MKLFLTLLFTVATSSETQAFRGEKIKLESQLQEALNQILATSAMIQEAFFNQDESQIEISTRKVLSGIQKARQNTSIEKINGRHIDRILDVVSNHLAQLLDVTGEERKRYLRLAFDQVVHIAQTYKLDNYRIFYCQSSDGIWIQKSYKAQNPYNPQTLANCGIPVR